ncbi:permease prefix domain 1-containing protein [Deinococcus soli (ex Cha et al. 2016)]|uniref:Uncharacterized protein n=2 Tax=Deinococcus soli (ex Cha et al. 2016) TaxID=1309411 RepID=A0AAE3XIW5_9DEIO|nr:permease prefix domain 1-containing protein [Deinococcus soli (ex Cha et al. 2016)]MDR6221319.1 hypothetical protein [Deinococcus soli (ex Cha et al. 2016)]MDR6331288.1 hypothetical protein [Deinococcus soli (ex Cha et al. 2016)]MDR6754468.1 hypothetical protein [Deinococcus soli (ex Cha et al. 2016)]
MTRDQFIRHATRGLWGTRKRDAALELRGAIEDKIYRHQLCGLSELEAEQAALRDLGSPHAIARDLSRVHTAPAAIRATLLLGVAGLLSMQAVAQIPAVGSAFMPNDVDIQQCDYITGQAMADRSPAMRARIDRLLAQAGGLAGLREQCRAGAFATLGPLLNVADLLTALKAAQVPVNADASASSVLLLKGGLNGSIPQVSFQTQTIGGQRYLPGMFLITFLQTVTTQPFTLTGQTNPVLTIGSARVPIGSARAPVQTVDVLAHGLSTSRRTDTSLPLPVSTIPMTTTLPIDPAAPQLAVPGQDGEVFAVVQNILRINEDRRGADAPETLWVRARQGGRIAFTDELNPNIRLVNSQAELDQATARGVKAAVVYRVNTANLQHPALTVVPAAQVRVVQP